MPLCQRRELVIARPDLSIRGQCRILDIHHSALYHTKLSPLPSLETGPKKVRRSEAATNGFEPKKHI